MARSATWTLLLLSTLVLGALCDEFVDCSNAYEAWKKSYGELKDKKCFDASIKDETVAHSINCDSDFCVSETPLVMQELLDLNAECEGVKEDVQKDPKTFVIDPTHLAHANNLVSAPLDMCNECTEQYAEMRKINDTMVAKSCVPSALSYSCTDECKELTASYIKMWSHLLEDGVCRAHMPGGCGNGGGISEGAVYDILVQQQALITSYQTLPAACEDSCMKAYKGWYRNWERVIDDECMVVDGANVDFEANGGRMAFAQFADIDPTCTDKCMHSINDRLIRTFYVLPVNCRVAGPQDHFHQLRMNTGVNACDAEHATYGAVLSLNMVANVIIVLSIFGASLLGLYCILASAKNFFLRGNRGLDILPNPLDWKRFVVVSNNGPVEIQFTTRRPRAEDEEKLIDSSN